MISLRKLFQQTFEGHKGRPGLVGGSMPRSGGGSGSPYERARQDKAWKDTEKHSRDAFLKDKRFGKPVKQIVSDIADSFLEEYDPFDIYDENGQFDDTVSEYLDELIDKASKGMNQVESSYLMELAVADIIRRTKGKQ